MAIDVEVDQLSTNVDRSRPFLQQLPPSGRAQEVTELDLVIPALNEEDRIGATIAAISAGIAAKNWSIRLIVVDNGCVDKTVEVVDAARSLGIPLEVIGCRTRGKGAAVRRGVLHSSAPYVGFCDADLSTPPDAIGEGLDLLHAGWEVVVGSRRCLGGSYMVSQSRLRQLGGFLFRVSTAHRVGPLSDSQCGFKLFRSDIARALFTDSRLDGFAFDVEILARVVRDGHRIIELPIKWSDQRGSSFRPVADGIEVIRSLRQLRHEDLRSEVAPG